MSRVRTESGSSPCRSGLRPDGSDPSGATVVQIVHANQPGLREIVHIGSAHAPDGVEVRTRLTTVMAAPEGGADDHLQPVQASVLPDTLCGPAQTDGSRR